MNTQPLVPQPAIVTPGPATPVAPVTPVPVPAPVPIEPAPTPVPTTEPVLVIPVAPNLTPISAAVVPPVQVQPAPVAPIPAEPAAVAAPVPTQAPVPVTPAVAPVVQPTVAAVASPVPTSPATTPMRVKPLVLLIEDENLITIMYSKKLELDGYECLVALNGVEGVRLAKEKLPDLILCDIMMPEKDGLSTLKDLKADPTTQSIPVIMLTNLSDEKYVTQALDMGAISFLIKSKILPADVITKVKEVLIANGKTSLLSKAA